MAEKTLEGQQALDAIKPRLDALIKVPNRLPGVGVEPALLTFKPTFDQLNKDRDDILSIYNEATIAAVIESMELLPTVWTATLHASQHLQRTTVPKDAPLAALVDEGRRLREKGFKMLNLLVFLEIIASENETAVRRGRSIVDLAGDLNVLGHLGRKHFDVIEPIEVLKKAPSKPLTAEDLTRMIALSALLNEGTGTDPSDPIINWREVTIRCWALLKTLWDEIHNLMGASLRYQGQGDRAKALVSLHAFGRRAD